MGSRIAARQLTRPNVRTLSVYDPPDYGGSNYGGGGGRGIIPKFDDIWHPLHPANPIFDDDNKKNNNRPDGDDGGKFLVYLFMGFGGYLLLCNILSDKESPRRRY